MSGCCRMGSWRARSSAWLWLPRRIKLAGLVHVAQAVLVTLEPHVDVGIDRGFVDHPGADLEVDHILLAAVDQAMAVAAVGLEARGLAGLEHCLGMVVLAQYDFAFEDEDEFVLVAVPVALRRP